METIKIWNDRPSDSQTRRIAEIISEGELAILPTDSVYSIVCDALNQKAINDLCRVKGINPEKNHLSIMCADISMAAEYAHIDNPSFHLLKEYAPGPFTFLFKSGRKLPKVFKGRKTVGIRIPDSNALKEIIMALGHPLMCTSIEYEDSDHAREPELIGEYYSEKGISLIVDGGDGEENLTTIVDCTNGDTPVILREGKGEIFLDS